MVLRRRLRSISERLLKLAVNEWEKIKKRFSPISFPEPEIRVISRGLRLYVDSEKWKGVFYIGKEFNDFDDYSLQKIFKVVWIKYISYFFVCPLNAGNILEMLVHGMLETSSEKLSIIAVNLLIELETWYYLLKSYPEETLFFIKNVLLKLGKNDPAMILIIMVLEITTTVPIIPEEIKRKIKNYEVLRELAEEISDILNLGGVLNRLYWPKKVGLIGKVLKKQKIKALSIPLLKISVTSPDTVRYISKASGFFGLVDSFSRITRRFKWRVGVAGPAIKIIAAIPRRKKLIKMFYTLKARDYLRPILFKFFKERKKSMWKYKIFPQSWNMGDPIEELDVHLSLSVSPILVPGETTKKWKKVFHYEEKEKTKKMNILIVLDTSGSMTWKPNVDGRWTPFFFSRYKEWMLDDIIGTRYDLALTLTYALIEIAERMNARLSLVNFSGYPKVVEWGFSYEQARDLAIELQRNGTILPVLTLKKLLNKVDNAFIVIISDCDFFNEGAAYNFLNEMAKNKDKYKVIIVKTKIRANPRLFQLSGVDIKELKNEEDVKSIIKSLISLIVR